MALSKQQLISENLTETVPLPPLQGLVGGYAWEPDNLAAFLRDEGIIARRLGAKCPDIYGIEAQELYQQITHNLEEPQRHDLDDTDSRMESILHGLTLTFISDVLDPGVDSISDSVDTQLRDIKRIWRKDLPKLMLEAYERDKANLEFQGYGH